MRKLGKKRLLGLLTATAIVATTVGSFAVWDTLTATSSGKLTVTSPIVVKTQDISSFTPSRDATTNVPVYTGSVQFGVDGLTDATGKQLNLECVVKDNKGGYQTDNFDVAITGTGNDAVTNNVDTNVGTTNTYSVEIKAHDSDEAKALAGQELTVEVTGKLADTPSVP